MPLRAAFFDVGDTLVEHWAPREEVNRRARERICAELGEASWLDDLLGADLEPVYAVSLAEALAARESNGPRFMPDDTRQETLRWYRDWFEGRGIDVAGVDLDRLRSLMCVPLDEISTPVPGAFEALRWCADHGLRVVLVTNTLSRGDREALEDWRRAGLGSAIHGVVSSHSAGWRKPHPAIFERALEIADARPEEVFHVGDNLICDVYGAQQLGMRAVWRRVPRPSPPPTDERGAPASRADRERTSSCRHPSDRLRVEDGVTLCVTCDRTVSFTIRPDAIVDDLTELPQAVRPWLRAP